MEPQAGPKKRPDFANSEPPHECAHRLTNWKADASCSYVDASVAQFRAPPRFDIS